jgi:hypothetical protein
MARIEGGKYVPNPKIKVRKAAIDKMNAEGMDKSVAHANSGNASEEEVEAARRFYGARITGTAKKTSPTVTKSLPGPQSATVRKTAVRKHVTGEAAAPSNPKPVRSRRTPGPSRADY